MKRVRSVPANSRMGNCIHARLTKTTEDAFKSQAEEMSVALATYVRMYIEEMYDRHGLLEFNLSGQRYAAAK